tara:strand:+ start:1991 stop:2797 length:807 start_codon:yes stop_codon:yes gene_type:complete
MKIKLSNLLLKQIKMESKLIVSLQKARNYFNLLKIEKVHEKAPIDYVTNIDFQVNNFLHKELANINPEAKIFSEETKSSKRNGVFWIIDPIDGTHNMLSGIPFFSISIALCDSEGPLVSGVANLSNNDVYSATRSLGARKNGCQIKRKESNSNLIFLSTGMLNILMQDYESYKIIRSYGKIRNLGCQSLQLCFVAEGKARFCMSEEAKFWDDAAGQLIARESGMSYFSKTMENTNDIQEIITEGKSMKSLCAENKIFEKVKDIFNKKI